MNTTRALLEHGANVNLDYDALDGKPVTVLDSLLKMLNSAPEGVDEDHPHFSRFFKLKKLLLEHGASTYAELQKDDKLKEKDAKVQHTAKEEL